MLRAKATSPPAIAAHQQFSGWNINGTVRDFRWVPFYCSIPQGGVWPAKLLIQSPVKNGRSIFNLKTARYEMFIRKGPWIY